MQELNDQAVADLLSEEIMVPEADTETDPIFIDINDIFAKHDLTDENKEFIKNLLGKSNYNRIIISSDEEEDDRQDLIQTDLFNKDLVGEDTKTDYDIPSLFDKSTFKPEPLFEVVPKQEIDLPTIDPTVNVTNENGDNDLVYVNYIPQSTVILPQLIHPTDRYRKKVKEEWYRRRTKKRAIQALIKKTKKAIDNALLKNTTVQGDIDDDNVDIDLRVMVPDNEDNVDFQIKTAGSKNDDDDDDDVIYVNYILPPPDNPVPLMHPRDRLKQRVKKIRKSKEKYRVNAKKKAIKYLNKRKAEMLLKDQKKKPTSKAPIQNIEKNTPVDNEDDIDFQIETAGSKNDEGDIVFVKYVPPPPENPITPIHPRYRLKQRVRKIRQKKGKVQDKC